MSDRDQFDKAFRNERNGFGAGVPTSLGGTLGQMSARQQQDVASGRVRHGASGALVLELWRGGPIGRGILIVVAGFIAGVASANAPSSSWGVVAGMLGSSLLILAGGVMIAVGLVKKIYRKLR